MGTNQDDLAKRLRLDRPRSVGALPPLDWSTIGVFDEEEEEEVNPLQALLAGTAAGIIEPLGIIKPVEDAVEWLRQFRGDDTTDHVAYELGRLVGWFVPGTPAYKVGGRVARAAGLTQKIDKTTDIAKAADEVLALSTAGKFARGATAGALLTIGRESDSPIETAAQTLAGAAGFGVGDVVMDRVIAAAAARFGGKVPELVKEFVEDQLERGVVKNQDAVDAHAFAMGLLDQLDNVPLEGAPYEQVLAWQRSTGLPIEMGRRRHQLALGLDQLGLDKVRPGEVRVTVAPQGETRFMDRILEQVDGIDFVHTSRSAVREIPGLTEAARKEGLGLSRQKFDFYAVALKGDLDDGMKAFFAENGFLPSQEFLMNGARWVATGTSKGGRVVARRAEDLSKPSLFPKEKVRWLPFASGKATDRLSADTGPRMWAKFIQEHGAVPEASILPTPGAGPELPKKGFSQIFDEFAEANGFTGWAAKELKAYFIKRQKDVLKESFPEEMSVLARLEAFAGLSKSPTSDLAQAAAERGMTWRYAAARDAEGSIILDSTTKQIDEWTIELVDLATGQKYATGLTDELAATEWLKKFYRDLPEFGKDVVDKAPIDLAAMNPARGQGGGTTPPFGAGEVQSIDWSPDIRLPTWLIFTEPFIPRYLWVSMALNNIRKQGAKGTEFVLGAYDDVRAAFVHYRNASKAAGETILKGLKNQRGYEKLDISRRSLITDLMTLRGPKRAEYIARHGISPEEVGWSDQLRTSFVDAWNDIREGMGPYIPSGEDFLLHYMNEFRRTSARDLKGLVKRLKAQGKPISEEFFDFLSEMHAKGVVTKWDNDAFRAGMRFVRSLAFHKHARQPIREFKKLVEQLPGKGGLPGHVVRDPSNKIWMLTKSLANYMDHVTIGAPEAYYVVRETMKSMLHNMGIEVPEYIQKQWIESLIAMNYGAFMGFRPGLAIRNLTQTFITTYPLLGGKYTALGVKTAFSDRKAAMRELVDSGVIAEHMAPVFAEDMVFHENVNRAVKTSAKAVRNLSDTLTRAAHEGIGGKWFGWYTRADHVNRAIAYFGGKRKVLDALKRMREEGRSVEWFNQKAGLTKFGETFVDEFHRRFANLSAHTAEDAAKWVGARIANETQFVYQLAQGPPILQSGLGRLFGMYGTWPSWYFGLIAKNLTMGTTGDRVGWALRSVIATGGMVTAGAQLGLDLSRWTGISSLQYRLGPYFDVFTDFLDVWGGVTATGESTAARSIALAQRGISEPEQQYTGLDPRRYDVDWKKFAIENLVPITPGSLAFKDIIAAWEAAGAGDFGTAAAEALNLPQMTVGQDWPEVQIRR